MTILNMDASGRVQFPETIRQEFGLTDAVQLSLEVRDGAMILIPIPTTIPPTHLKPNEPQVYYKGNVLVVETSEADNVDINQFIDDLREERIQEQMGL